MYINTAMATMNNAIMWLNFFEVINWFEEDPEDGYESHHVNNNL